jgi:hypothetical protein
MGKLAHLSHVTPSRTLQEIEVEVFETIDRMALNVGRLLREAQEIAPKEFRGWVEERLPFGIDAARRLIAVHLAYSELSNEQIDKLPYPWQALYALRKFVDTKLPEALASGEIGVHTTQVQAIRKAREWSQTQNPKVSLTPRYKTVDLVAGKLMTFEPSDLNPDVLRALTRWMARS